VPREDDVTLADLLATLPEAAREATQEELPALLGKVTEAEAILRMRINIVACTEHKPEPEPQKWITPEQAAGIAQVPKERIYTWAERQRWASRPSRRCLRIEEAGFRRWLVTRGR
jgi:hypothetical protein